VAIKVCVMPLRNNRTEADVEAFLERLETLLGFRPDWDEGGPVRSATVFSVDGFSSPFLRARAWSYRLKLPRLCALEMPQVWLPVEFDPAFQFAPPWNPDGQVSVASSPRLGEELEQLLEKIAEEDRPDLADTGQVAGRLREIAALSVEHRAPVIVEG
jgi:hypothetical protein